MNGSHYALKRAVEADILTRTGRKVCIPYVRHQGNREKARRLRRLAKTCERASTLGTEGPEPLDAVDSSLHTQED